MYPRHSRLIWPVVPALYLGLAGGIRLSRASLVPTYLSTLTPTAASSLTATLDFALL